MQPSADPLPEVTVLLGDPHLPDAAKLRGHFAAEDLESFELVRRALDEIPGTRFRYLDDHTTLIAELLASPPPFVLNFCDTGYRNRAELEAHIPALLELLEIPYSGAGPGCLALCYDKAAVRAIAREMGVPVPVERFVAADEPVEAVLDDLPALPALLKPNRGDGSVGITQDAVAHDVEQARGLLERLRRELPGRDLLVQEFLTGTEYGVGLIGNPATELNPLPVMEVGYEELGAGLTPILAYESKADPDSPYYTRIAYREARLDGAQGERMVEHARRLFERLGCRDYARFDFRADAAGTSRLLEVNPNPAWCWDGKMCFMAGFAGWRYPELLAAFLEAARARLAAGASG